MFYPFSVLIFFSLFICRPLIAVEVGTGSGIVLAAVGKHFCSDVFAMLANKAVRLA